MEGRLAVFVVVMVMVILGFMTVGHGGLERFDFSYTTVEEPKDAKDEEVRETTATQRR